MKTAHQLIEDKTIEAIGKMNSIKPPSIKKPVTMRQEVVERGNIKAGPGVKIIDGRTYEVKGDTVEEAFYGLF